MMADRFIDQLNELTDPATGDWLVIEDVSAGETKKIHPGTATFLDVQTSPTDTTAGRVLTVGAFGVGDDNQSIISSGDLDDFLANGAYYVAGGVANTPIGATVFVQVFGATESGGGRAAQVAIHPTRDEIFVRRRSSGAWEPWRELYHTGNLLGTVSQSGGVPTGAVIERGSNSNGEFVRLADGTQICTISNFPVASINTAVGQIFRSGGQTWTTPAAFLSGATTSLQGYCQNLSVCSLASGFTTPSGSALPFSVIRPTSTTTETLWALVAIGRWF